MKDETEATPHKVCSPRRASHRWSCWCTRSTRWFLGFPVYVTACQSVPFSL